MSFNIVIVPDAVNLQALPTQRISFCKNCGSSLPWMTKSGKAVVVTAGTLDDDPEVKPVHNIFMADKAPWYEEVGSLMKYEALPVTS